MHVRLFQMQSKLLEQYWFNCKVRRIYFMRHGTGSCTPWLASCSAVVGCLLKMSHGVGQEWTHEWLIGSRHCINCFIVVLEVYNYVVCKLVFSGNGPHECQRVSHIQYHSASLMKVADGCRNVWNLWLFWLVCTNLNYIQYHGYKERFTVNGRARQCFHSAWREYIEA